LKGGRIGLRSYENTLALVTKGMLMNSYDLGVSDVTWVIVNKEHVGFKLPPSIKVEFVEGKRKLEDLLVEGTVDARSSRTCCSAGFVATARWNGCSRVREGRAKLLPADRHLPDHAPCGDQEGDSRPRPMGGHQLV
jgi:hypothetical protein